MIRDVFIKELVTHGDDRGYFREIIRAGDNFFKDSFGQLSHSLVEPGILKAWHGHKIQTQWTYIVDGLFKVAIHDFRKDSPTYRETMEFYAGKDHPPVVYSFPPGVAHGYSCIEGPAYVFYVTSGEYDSEDEVRIPHDDLDTGYLW